MVCQKNENLYVQIASYGFKEMDGNLCLIFEC